MGGRGRTLLLVGVVVLLIAALAVVFMLRQGGDDGEVALEPVGTPTPSTTQIVVAIQDIPRGEQVMSGTVDLADWPIGRVPAGAMVSVDKAMGQYVRFDLPSGVPILPGMLAATLGELAGVSDLPLKILPGKVAVALPVSRLSSVAYALMPGDHVDVLASFWVIGLDEEFQSELQNNMILIVPAKEEEINFVQFNPGGREGSPLFGYGTLEHPSGKQYPRVVSQLTVQNAVVLGVGDWLSQGAPAATPVPQGGQSQQTEETGPSGPDIVTLIVDPQDALVIKFLRETGAVIDLALRSAGDKEGQFSTEAVTIQYMFTRFQMAEPPKLPYGVVPAPTPSK
ncbi:MAG: Flp pilus assembly protein CpaB [Thermoflexales bacterium]|nr:Flp pilus assembly protein CpaB [Thermoflexales bacterium]